MQEEDVERLVQDAGIIRHRGKFRQLLVMRGRTCKWNGTATVCRLCLVVRKSSATGDTSQTLSEIPTSTPASDALSKALKSVVLSLSVPQSVTPLCRHVAGK